MTPLGAGEGLTMTGSRGSYQLLRSCKALCFDIKHDYTWTSNGPFRGWDHDEGMIYEGVSKSFEPQAFSPFR